MTEREKKAVLDGTLTPEAVDEIRCSFELGGAVWKISLAKDGKNTEKKNEN